MKAETTIANQPGHPSHRKIRASPLPPLLLFSSPNSVSHAMLHQAVARTRTECNLADNGLAHPSRVNACMKCGERDSIDLDLRLLKARTTEWQSDGTRLIEREYEVVEASSSCNRRMNPFRPAFQRTKVPCVPTLVEHSIPGL